MAFTVDRQKLKEPPRKRACGTSVLQKQLHRPPLPVFPASPLPKLILPGGPHQLKLQLQSMLFHSGSLKPFCQWTVSIQASVFVKNIWTHATWFLYGLSLSLASNDHRARVLHPYPLGKQSQLLALSWQNFGFLHLPLTCSFLKILLHFCCQFHTPTKAPLSFHQSDLLRYLVSSYLTNLLVFITHDMTLDA